MSKQVYVYGDYLMHHGIKGQEWGVQNGPPYPLDQKSVMKDIANATKNTKANPHRKGLYESDVIKNIQTTNDDIKSLQKEYSDLQKEVDDYLGFDFHTGDINNKGKKLINKFDNIDGSTPGYENTKSLDEMYDKFIEINLPKLKDYSNRLNELNDRNEKLVNDMVENFGNVKVKKVFTDDGKQSTINSLFNTNNRLGIDLNYINSRKSMIGVLNSISEYLWETSDY